MSRSETLFANAQKHIPGGVNPLCVRSRAWAAMPLFFKHAGRRLRHR